MFRYFFSSGGDRLYFIFNSIIELKPFGVKKLYPVVFVGVVRRGDHDAGVRMKLSHEIRHPGCGKYSGLDHISPHGQNPGRQSIFQHISGNPRILRYENQRSFLRFSQHTGSRLSQSHGEFRCQFRICHTSHAVCSK